MEEGKKQKILLTEDDNFIRNAYKESFERNGLIVITASSGEEALQILRDEKPDLMLLDLVMAGKDGFQVLSDIRADHTLKEVPVIILSNLGQDEDIQRCKELGAMDYMIKANHSIHEVVNRVKENLKKE